MKAEDLEIGQEFKHGELRLVKRDENEHNVIAYIVGGVVTRNGHYGVKLQIKKDTEIQAVA